MVALSSDVESLALDGLLCVILLVATVSNSLLLLVFYRQPRLRTISNRFVINLLVTNLISCWTLLPSMLADNMWRQAWAGRSDSLNEEEAQVPAQVRSALPCLLFEGIAIGLCVACVLSVVMIGVDQYFAVIDPLRYHAAIKAVTSALMIAVSWILSATFGVLGAISANSGCAWYACQGLDDGVSTWPLHPPNSYRVAFAGLFVAFAFIAPFGAICWIYLSICAAARQNHKRATRHGSAASCGIGATSGQEAALLEYAYGQRVLGSVCEYVEFDLADDGLRCPSPLSPCRWDQTSRPLHHSSTKGSLKSTSSSIVNSLRHRISNASMFRYREETRAARISFLVIVMALFCWLPFTLVLVVRTSLLLARLSLPHYVKQMGILSLSSNAVISPLIFAHRNRRIHRELCRIFRVPRRRASFYRGGGESGNGGNLDSGDVVVKQTAATPPCNTKADTGKRLPLFRETLTPGQARPFVDSGQLAKQSNESSTNNGPCAVTVAVAVAAATAQSPATSKANDLVSSHDVSILNLLWCASASAERDHHRRPTFHLPEVTFETDTSRSSFSSIASTGSHHHSNLLASVSDAAAEDC